MLTPRIALFLSLLAVVVFIGVNILLVSGSQTPPKIQGVVVPEGRALQPFKLVDHHHREFTEQSLRDRWFLLSYGFTDCPDVCPTTLSKLAKFEKRLRREGRYTDLRVLFYTVDPQRDTVEHLAQYVKFFSEDFIGLTYGPELATNHIPLERTLGMVTAIDPLPHEEAKWDDKGYSVSHGVVLYLINPQGKLQAILKPDINRHGAHFFDGEKIYRDYLALRQYFAGY